LPSRRVLLLRGIAQWRSLAGAPYRSLHEIQTLLELLDPHVALLQFVETRSNGVDILSRKVARTCWEPLDVANRQGNGRDNCYPCSGEGEQHEEEGAVVHGKWP